MTGDVHTTKPLADAEWLATSGAWGVYLHDANTEAGELVGAAFGEHAQKRAELFVAALELSRKLSEREPEADEEPVQPDFRCAIEQRQAVHEGQNHRCAEQCAHCRTQDQTIMFGGAAFTHDTGAQNAARA